MPIFSCEIRGDAKARVVRADSAAAARAHLVTCKTLKASELADLLADGATIERADDPEPAEQGNGKAAPAGPAAQA